MGIGKYCFQRPLPFRDPPARRREAATAFPDGGSLARAPGVVPPTPRRWLFFPHASLQQDLLIDAKVWMQVSPASEMTIHMLYVKQIYLAVAFFS